MRWLVFALLIVSVVGCSSSQGDVAATSVTFEGFPPEAMRKISLLFTSDGRERSSPVSAMCSRLARANDTERDEMLRYLAELLNGDGGYTRFFAAQALTRFFDDKENWPAMTPEVAGAIARNLVVVNDLRDKVWFEPQMLTADPEYLKDTFYWVVRPRTRAMIEGRAVSVATRMDLGIFPNGWWAKEASAQLDGVVIAAEEFSPPVDDINASNYCYFPSIYAAWTPRLFPEDPDAVSEHVLVSRILLVAPNGTEIEVKKETTVHVAPHGPM